MRDLAIPLYGIHLAFMFAARRFLAAFMSDLPPDMRR
jgi:hypothetical protein